MENTRAGLFWVGLAYVLLYPAMFISFIIFMGELLNQIIPGGITLIAGDNGFNVAVIAVTLLVAMNIALYTVVSLVTLALAAGSISREKTNKTWETLLLTGVDASQLVRGKWWATVRTLWKDFALVWLLRLGMVAWLVHVTEGEFLFRESLFNLSTDMTYMLFGAAMVAVYTLLDAMLTAALGVVAALADIHPGAVTLGAIALRLVLTFLPLSLPFYFYTQHEIHEAIFYMGFWGVCLLITALLTVGLLRLAQTLAVRQHALPPGA